MQGDSQAQPVTVASDYFGELMRRHSTSLAQVQKAVQSQTDRVQQHIEQGRYDIRQAQQPVVKRTTYSNSEELKLKDVHCGATQMIELRKSLEGKLNMLQNNLQQLTDKTQIVPKVQLTQKEHEEFMKQIARTNKELQQQKEERRKAEQRKLHQREEELRHKEEAIRQERERKKKEEIQEKLRKLNEIKDRRQHEGELQNRALSSLLQSKPLYEKIEEKHTQFQAQSLEEKKRKLAEIRALHRPVTKEQLEQHEKKVEAIREKRQQEREQRRNEASSDRAIPEVYKSQWYKKVLDESKEEEKARKNSEELQLEQARQLRDKSRQYGDYVKTHFKPEVDPQKALELKGNTEQKVEIKPEQARKMGLQNLRYSKEHINPKAASGSEMSSTNGNIQLTKPINYLEELKRQRVTSSPANETEALQNILKKPMNEEQKTRKLLEHVTRLEQAAKRKEQLARSNNQRIDEELDELYMNTAKAKLALLN